MVPSKERGFARRRSLAVEANVVLEPGRMSFDSQSAGLRLADYSLRTPFDSPLARHERTDGSRRPKRESNVGGDRSLLKRMYFWNLEGYPSTRNRPVFDRPTTRSGHHSTHLWPAMSEPAVRRRRTVGESNGAEGGIRTPTVLLPPAPQAGASASSATSARARKNLKFRCFTSAALPASVSLALPVAQVSSEPAPTNRVWPVPAACPRAPVRRVQEPVARACRAATTHCRLVHR